MYKVELEGANDIRFKFKNYDDAYNFMFMAVDNGIRTVSHYDTKEGAFVIDGEAPVKASVVGVEE